MRCLAVDSLFAVKNDSLIQAMPDLVAFIRRDGVVLRHVGGRQVRTYGEPGSLDGRRLQDIWPQGVATMLERMLRRAFSDRGSVEAQFSDGDRKYEARLSAQGAERALCVLREIASNEPEAARDGRQGAAPRGVDRRNFLVRLKREIAAARLTERPLAVAMIHLEGLDEIARVIDFAIAERIATLALRRLPEPSEADARQPPWFLGQLGENLLGVAITDFADAADVQRVVTMLCDSLRAPIDFEDARWCLTPSAGVSLLGQDAQGATMLLDHARAATLEARRGGSGGLQFYSDGLQLRPLARLDFERELREAIGSAALQLRYVGRYTLGDGQLQAIHAYLRWPHPLRGDVRPAEFIPIAESTGLAGVLSRWALSQLRKDLPSLRAACGARPLISFGALRHHVADPAFAGEVAEWLEATGMPRDRLELRIAERTLATLGSPERSLARLADLGALLSVDEFGRGYSSLASLARLPLHAVQLDRGVVIATGENAASARVCAAALAMARALNLEPLAAGVDDEPLRCRLLGLGCSAGVGDAFPAVSILDAAASRRASGER